MKYFIQEKQANNYQCCVSLCVPWPDDATENSGCGNIFWNSCINKCNSICPLCKMNLDDDSIKNVKTRSKKVYSMLFGLEIRCLLNDACSWVGEIIKWIFICNMQIWMYGACSYRMIPCQYCLMDSNAERHGASCSQWMWEWGKPKEEA